MIFQKQNSLAEKILLCRSVALVSHIRPDGDCIGSLVALKLGLEQIGIDVNAYLLDELPSDFEFVYKHNGAILIEKNLTQIKKEENPENISLNQDLLIAVDVSDTQRTGMPNQVKDMAKAQKFAWIDHHPKGDLHKLSSFNLHDQSAAANCIIIYKLLLELNIKITPSIATALLFGIYTDTGGFQFSNTNNQALDTAAELMVRGGKFKSIVNKVAKNKSVANLKLTGVALQRIRLTNNSQCAISILDNADIQSCEAGENDLTGIANTFNHLPDPQFTLLLTEYQQGTVRGVLRTNEGKSFDVSRLARILGGGGHPKASGFILNGNLFKTKKFWKVV